MKRLIRIGLTALILAIANLQGLPAQAAKPIISSYPVLPSGQVYYTSTFPAGLRYSSGWYGTFENAPPATVWLFDDDYNADWGICVFSMPPGIMPAGPQGGTGVLQITLADAQAIIESYPLSDFQSLDPEIQAVMPLDEFYSGVWAGDKLAEKFNVNPATPDMASQTQKQKDYLTSIKDKPVKKVNLSLYDPPRFWVGDGGSWTDNATHWAAASGGAPGASLPTNADETYFDVNSFTAAGQTVTMDANGVCLSMNWTGATNTPAFALGSKVLDIYGDVVFISDMTIPNVGSANDYLNFRSGATQTLTTNGVTVGANIVVRLTSELSLADSLTQSGIYSGVSLGVGGTSATLTTNNFDIDTTSGIKSASGGTINIAFGTSSITVHDGNYDLDLAAGANITGAYTLTVLGSATFGGGGNTFYDVVLSGTAHSVTGNNVYHSLTIDNTATETITFAGGSIQTANTFTLDGSSGHYHTLVSSNATPWRISLLAGTLDADYIDISYCTANVTGGQTYNGNGMSINSGNNTGWTFPTTFSITNSALSGNTAIITYSVTDKGGVASPTAVIQWGYDTSYGSTTAAQTITTVGSYNDSFTFNSQKTAHYRLAFTAGATTTYTADYTIQIGLLPEGNNLIKTIVPLLVACAVIIAAIGISMRRFDIATIAGGTVMAVLAYIVTYLAMNALF